MFFSSNTHTDIGVCNLRNTELLFLISLGRYLKSDNSLFGAAKHNQKYDLKFQCSDTLTLCCYTRVEVELFRYLLSDCLPFLPGDLI